MTRPGWQVGAGNGEEGQHTYHLLCHYREQRQLKLRGSGLVSQELAKMLMALNPRRAVFVDAFAILITQTVATVGPHVQLRARNELSIR
jgi:hypothetical protein